MSANREVVVSDSAPKPFPVMPFSAAVKSNGNVFVSGTIAWDNGAGKLVEGDVKDRTRHILTIISGILKDAGSDLNKIVKANVYLIDMKKDFAPMNEAYLEFYPDSKELPARTCVQVSALPMGTDVEIECVAALN